LKAKILIAIFCLFFLLSNSAEASDYVLNDIDRSTVSPQMPNTPCSGIYGQPYIPFFCLAGFTGAISSTGCNAVCFSSFSRYEYAYVKYDLTSVPIGTIIGASISTCNMGGQDAGQSWICVFAANSNNWYGSTNTYNNQVGYSSQLLGCNVGSGAPGAGGCANITFNSTAGLQYLMNNLGHNVSFVLMYIPNSTRANGWSKYYVGASSQLYLSSPPPTPICRPCDWTQLGSSQVVLKFECLLVNLVVCNPMLVWLIVLFLLIIGSILYIRTRI